MRIASFAGIAATLLITAGCDQRGLPGMRDEWERRRAEQFFVMSASSEAAVISALGKEVAIRPAEGFCLSRESIETSSRSAVALIGDCALEGDVNSATRSSKGELNLPRSLPGIITVSISGNPEVRSSGLDADRIEEFLQSKQGKSLIGRSSDGSGVTIHESRSSEDVVYLLVEDSNGGPVPILSDTFWRAFMTLNDRLTVITISAFRASPIGVESMLEHLTEQVETLRVANADGTEEMHELIAQSEPLDAERVVSAGDAATDQQETTSLSALQSSGIAITTTGATESTQEGQGEAATAVAENSTDVAELSGVTVVGEKTIIPAARRATRSGTGSNSAPEAVSGLAPVSSPLAPRRRKRS